MHNMSVETKMKELTVEDIFPWISSKALDDQRRSRQEELLDGSDVQVMLEARVLIVGFNAVGVEVVKNLMLLGFGNIDLYDPELVTWIDVNCSHVFWESDMDPKNFDTEGGSRRTSERVLNRIRKINEDCKLRSISKMPNSTDEEKVKYTFVVCCNQLDTKLIDRASKLVPNRFIDVQVRGLVGRFYSDYKYSREDWNDSHQKFDFLTFAERCPFTKRDQLDDDSEEWLEPKPNTPERQFMGIEFDIMEKEDDMDAIFQAPQGKKKKKGREKPIADFFDKCESLQYHVSFWGMHLFYEKFGRLPKPYDTKDADEFMGIIEESYAVKHGLFADHNMRNGQTLQWVRDREFYDVFEQRLFAFTCASTVAPMCSIFGGLVANEVMKISVGEGQEKRAKEKMKMEVVTESQKEVEEEMDFPGEEEEDDDDEEMSLAATAIPCFYYSGRRYIPQNLPKPEQCVPKDKSLMKYLAQVQIFGEEWQKFMLEQHVFVVGAGALSSETMKLLAIQGAKKVTVTDMDRIEISNLNRQFHYQSEDAKHKRMKSEVICEKMQELNPDIVHMKQAGMGEKVEAEGKRKMVLVSHTDKVQNMDLFPDSFYGKEIDAIILGLDNVPARNYCHEKGVLFNVPVFDSGLQGYFGNTWTFSPNETAEVVHGEAAVESIDKCTISNAPTELPHLVHYANYKFKEIFTYDTSKIRSVAKKMLEGGTVNEDDFRITYMRFNLETTVDCLKFAMWLWEQLFVTAPINRPKCWANVDRDFKFCTDLKTEDGKVCESFVKSAFLLACQCFNIEWEKDFELLDSFFADFDVKKHLGETKLRKLNKAEVEKHVKRLSCIKSVGKFDKDVQTHVVFQRAVSNIRRKLFKLHLSNVPQATDVSIKKMIGRMIPSIITPVSVLQGIVLLNYFNFISNKCGANGKTRRNYLNASTFNLRSFLYLKGRPHLLCERKWEPRLEFRYSEAPTPKDLIQTVKKVREGKIPNNPELKINLLYGKKSDFLLFKGELGPKGELNNRFRTPRAQYKADIMKKLIKMFRVAEEEKKNLSKVVPKDETEFDAIKLKKKKTFDVDVTRAEKFFLRFEWLMFPDRTYEKEVRNVETGEMEMKTLKDMTKESYEVIYIVDKKLDDEDNKKN